MSKVTSLIEYNKDKECPPELEWAIPLIEHQKTQGFKDKIGYEIALGMQRAQRRFEKRQEEKLKKSTMRE